MTLQPGQILGLIDVLLRSLATKVLCTAALLMTCALFAWAMYRARLLEFLIAATFVIGVFWPLVLVAWHGSKDNAKEQE